MARLARTVLATALHGLCAMSCAPARAVPVPIVIDQFAFPAASPVLRVGDTIAWTNNDVVDHTATGSNTEFDVVIPAKSTVTMQVQQAGRIPYFCRLHPNMTGTLDVSAR